MEYMLDNDEVATILAALRVYQRALESPEGVSYEIQDIATDGGLHVALDSGAINDLCERLNCEGEAA